MSSSNIPSESLNPSPETVISEAVAPAWNREQFSQSANSLLERLERKGSNTVIDIINAYYNYFEEFLLNPEIGAKPGNAHVTYVLQLKNFLLAKNISSKNYTVGQIAVLVLEQVKPVAFNDKESKVTMRLFITGFLLSLFDNLNGRVNEDDQLRQIMQQILHTLAQELPDEKPPVQLSEQLTDTGAINWALIFRQATPDLPETGNISDSPAMEDLLSRRALAKYLSNRLDYVYKTQVKNRGAFFMQVDGAWGSGKSTLLNFLKEYLTDKQKHAAANQPVNGDDWIVIDFDAWANQRLNPPWWYIMKSVYNSAGASFLKRKKYGAFLGLSFRENFWRLKTGTNYFVLAIITAVIAGIAIYSGTQSTEDFKKLGIIQILSLVSFVWASAKFLNTSLVPGSAKAAQNFIEQSGSDPMAVLADHFKKQVAYIQHPLAIFIDNLDRCNQEYGIKLLEGLQTIFKDAPVIYVVAADRKWLSKMYEKQYSDFADAIAKPGKPFGLIFLDKIFQLIVELPNISSVQRLSYWTYLLDGAAPKTKKAMEDKRDAIRTEVENKGSNKGKMSMIKTAGKNGIEGQLLREEVVSSLSIGEEEQLLENKLSEFYDIVEPNPRAMKRIINDMSTYRAITILYGQKVKDEVLVLYTILKLQYPQLSEYFWENPEKLDDLHASKNEVTGNAVMDNLLADPDVKRLFAYTMKNNQQYKIDRDFMMLMKFEKGEESISQ
ncbi:hypothetical protein BH10BAC3_BH10BAC3_04170 [soil metagenome]